MTDAADKVREFHRLGQRVLAAAPVTQEGYHPGVVAQFVTSGVSKPALYKARQFAELYSPRDLERICNRQLPDGRRLGVGHVYELIQISDARKRRVLEQRAAKEGWSSRRLRSERLLASGGQRKKPYAGRKPRLASSREGVLHQLRERTDQWLRWSVSLLAVVDPPPGPSAASNSSEGAQRPLRLPRSIRAELYNTNKALGRLKSALEQLQARRRQAQA